MKLKDYQEKFCEILSNSNSVSASIAACKGLTRDNYEKAISSSPDFAEAVKKAREIAIEKLEDKAYSIAMGYEIGTKVQYAALMELLMAAKPSKYDRKTITIPDGLKPEPLQINVVTKKG